MIIGDYPFCPHGSIFRQDALRFDPVLIYELPNGSHYYPGSNADGPPKDFPNAKPIVLDSLRKVDEYTRELNKRDQYDLDRRTEAERSHYDRVQRQSRESLRTELGRRGLNGSSIEAIIRDRDGQSSKAEVMQQFEAIAHATGQPFDRHRAEHLYEQSQRSRSRSRPKAETFVEAFAFDASNRRPHNDIATGWKNRK